jgi:hypothetical protein
MADPFSSSPARNIRQREQRRKCRHATADYCMAVGEMGITVDLVGIGISLLLDVSYLGFGLQVMSRVEPQSLLHFSFKIPDLQPIIEGEAKVIWCDDDGRTGMQIQRFARGAEPAFRSWIDSMKDVAVAEPRREQSGIRISQERSPTPPSQVSPSQVKVNATLQLLLGRAIKLTKAEGGAIALLNGDKMICRATYGLAPDVGAPISAESTLTSECVRTGKVVHCNDAEADQRVNQQICRDLNLRSSLILPILYSGTVRGVLEVFSPTPDAFGEKHVALLEQLAEFISLMLFASKEKHFQADTT